MFDQSSAARAYAFEDYEDTEVVDVEEPPAVSTQAPFPRGRVDTKDLIVHVRDDSDAWHRLHPTKLVTACGLEITNWKAGNTRAGLHVEHPLAMCECWTTAEREEANEKFRLGHGLDYEP
jgi:hypothetical protein